MSGYLGADAAAAATRGAVQADGRMLAPNEMR